MNLRAPGSAHTGLGEWLLQRVSALYMSVFALYVVLRLLVEPIVQYEAWRAWFASGGVQIGMALFFFSLLLHSWIGMRSVFMDYVKPMWLRFLVQLVTATGFLLLGLWVAGILLGSARA